MEYTLIDDEDEIAFKPRKIDMNGAPYPAYFKEAYFLLLFSFFSFLFSSCFLLFIFFFLFLTQA